MHRLSQITKLGLLNSSAERRLASEAVSKFNVRAPSIEQLVVNLSGGNQQKVILAKVLMDRPQILFLDEPIKGIDIGAKNEIYKLMLELVRQGISIVMISSELPEILGMSDRIQEHVVSRVQDAVRPSTNIVKCHGLEVWTGIHDFADQIRTRNRSATYRRECASRGASWDTISVCI